METCAFPKYSCWIIKLAAFTKIRCGNPLFQNKWTWMILCKTLTCHLIFSVTIFMFNVQLLCFIISCESLLLVRNTLQSPAVWFLTTMNNIMAPMSQINKFPFHKEWDFRWEPFLKLLIFPKFPLPPGFCFCLVFWIQHSHSTAWLPRLLTKTESGPSANRAQVGFT